MRLWRLFVLMIVPPLLMFAGALAVMLLPLPRPLPGAGSKIREQVAVVLVGLSAVAYLVAVITYVLRSFDRAGRASDQVLARYGLSSRSAGVFGRRYHGLVQGHAVDIQFQPARSPKPSLLNVYVSIASGGRAAIGQSRPLLDCRDCPEVVFSAPRLAGLRVFALDEAWIRAVLAEPSVQAAVANLSSEEVWGATNALYIQPNRIWWHGHLAPGTGSGEGSWLDEVLVLARALAAMPPTSQPS